LAFDACSPSSCAACGGTPTLCTSTTSVQWSNSCGRGCHSRWARQCPSRCPPASARASCHRTAAPATTNRSIRLCARRLSRAARPASPARRTRRRCVGPSLRRYTHQELLVVVVAAAAVAVPSRLPCRPCDRSARAQLLPSVSVPCLRRGSARRPTPQCSLPRRAPTTRSAQRFSRRCTTNAAKVAGPAQQACRQRRLGWRRRRRAPPRRRRRSPQRSRPPLTSTSTSPLNRPARLPLRPRWRRSPQSPRRRHWRRLSARCHQRCGRSRSRRAWFGAYRR